LPLPIHTPRQPPRRSPIRFLRAELRRRRPRRLPPSRHCRWVLTRELSPCCDSSASPYNVCAPTPTSLQTSRLGPALLLRPAAASVAGAGVEAVRAAWLAGTGVRPAPAPHPYFAPLLMESVRIAVHGFSLGAADLGACEPGKKHCGRPFALSSLSSNFHACMRHLILAAPDMIRLFDPLSCSCVSSIWWTGFGCGLLDRCFRLDYVKLWSVGRNL